MTPERRAEIRQFCAEGLPYCEVTPSEVVALLGALYESDAAYRGQGAAMRAPLADRDAEIVRLRESLQHVVYQAEVGLADPLVCVLRGIAERGLEPRA